MDFWAKCRDSQEICLIGLVLGVIITLLLVWVYMTFMKPAGEGFIGPNDLDSSSLALLAYKMQQDPVASGPIVAAANKKGIERLENKRENSKLVNLLYGK
jgi:hypothetical protein